MLRRPYGLSARQEVLTMRSALYAPLTLLLVLGCAHRPPEEKAARLGTLIPKAGSTKAVADQPKASAESCHRDWECGDGFLCMGDRCVAITDQRAACESGRVHFDFDQDAIHPDEY